MARYVLLAFDDNGEADIFIKMFESEKARGYSINVVGVFFKPTQFCACPTGQSTSRGKKYGLQVHSCGKPIEGRWQHPRNLIKEDGKTLYEQGLYLGLVEPPTASPPPVDLRERGKGLGITRR